MFYAGTGRYKLPKSSKLNGSAKATVLSTAVVTQKVTISVKSKGEKKKILKVKLEILANGVPYIIYDMALTGK